MRDVYSKDDKPDTFMKYFDSLIVLAFAIGIWVLISETIDFSSGSDNKFANPVLFPKLVSILLIALSIVQIINVYIKNRKRRGRKSVHEKKQETGEIKTFIVGILGLCGYVLLIPVAGFLIATVISVFCFVYFFGKPKWYKALLFSAVLAIIIYSIFSKFLNVPLPTSILS